MATVVLTVGDDVSTDVIYPGRFMATVLPTETPQYTFADDREFNSRLKAHEIAAGSIVAGGKNFGCGSSREQAVSALNGYGLVIVAKSFARIFLQNGINLGLQMIVCPDLEVSEGDELELTTQEILNKKNGTKFRVLPMPKSRQAIIDAQGLIPYTRKRLLERDTSLSAS